MVSLRTTICRKLSSSFTWQTMVQFHKTAILILSWWWLELTASAPLFICWLQAIKEDCLNYKPSSILARFFSHTSWDLFNIWLLHPTPWLTVKEYFPFNLYPFTTYFYIQRCSKDHYMWLKLGDIFRIDIKNHDMLQAKKLQESFMVTCYNWLFTLWRA